MTLRSKESTPVGLHLLSNLWPFPDARMEDSEKERAGPLPAAEGGEARCAGGPGRHKLAAEPPARPPPLPPLPFLPGTRLPGACSLGTLPPPPPPRRAHHGTAPTPLLLATALRLGARLLGPPIQGRCLLFFNQHMSPYQILQRSSGGCKRYP